MAAVKSISAIALLLTILGNVDAICRKTCERFPKASCTKNCNTCEARFCIGYLDVTESCDLLPVCPPKDLFPCFVNPCQFGQCERFPRAKCIPDYCRGCRARYFTHVYWGLAAVEITDLCPLVRSKCPADKPKSVCAKDPCDKKGSCRRYRRRAICKPDYCGGCHARYFIKVWGNYKEVTNRC